MTTLAIDDAGADLRADIAHTYASKASTSARPCGPLHGALASAAATPCAAPGAGPCLSPPRGTAAMSTPAETIQKRADLAEGIAGNIARAADILANAQAAARQAHCPVLMDATTKALKATREASRRTLRKRDQLERSLTRKTPREVTRERR